MFAENLLESSGLVRTNQRWTTLLSLALEGFLIALLVLIPLLQNQGMPRLRWISSVTTPLPPPPLGGADPGPRAGGGQGPANTPHVLVPPSVIPLHTDLTPDSQPSGGREPGTGWPLGVPDGVPGSTGPVFSAPPVAPQPVAPAPPPRLSFVTEGNIIHKVLPVYPPIARQIGAEGPVVLQAVIAADGTVQSLRVVSSAHPTLNEAALAAVSQWRFRPYLLNGVPVEVEAQITVNFVMSR